MNDVELAAGREMDALVAEKVLGCQVTRSVEGWPFCNCLNGPHADPSSFNCHLKRYSTDIKAAWELVEKVDLFKNCRHLYQEGVGDQKGTSWTRTGWRWVVVAVYEPLDHNDIIGFGDTPEMAICRAALEVAQEIKRAEESA